MFWNVLSHEQGIVLEAQKHHWLLYFFYAVLHKDSKALSVKIPWDQQFHKYLNQPACSNSNNNAKVKGTQITFLMFDVNVNWSSWPKAAKCAASKLIADYLIAYMDRCV